MGSVDFDSNADVALLAGSNMVAAEGENGDEMTIVSSGATNVGTLYVTVIFERLG